MSWQVTAICDHCGEESPVYATRSQLAGLLKREGWSKGGWAGQIYCPRCGLFGVISRSERGERAAKQKNKGAGHEY